MVGRCYWLFFIFLVASGCQKDTENVPPQIERVLPLYNSVSLFYEQTLECNYTISDNDALASYQAFLKNESGQIVFSKGGALSGNSSSVSFIIHHDDPHWASGNYTLSFQLEDAAGNTASNFLQIQLSEAPLELLNIFLITDDPGQSSSIYGFSSDGNNELLASVNHDIAASLAGSWYSDLVLGGDQLAELSFLSADNFSTLNQYSEQNPLGGSFISDIIFDADDLDYYVSTFDQQISRYGAGGNLEFTFQVNSSFRPTELAVWENLIIAITDPINNGDQTFNLYFKASGTLNLSLTLDFEVVELQIWEDYVVLFGNDAQNNPKLTLFDLESQSLFEPGWLVGSEEILAANYLEDNWFAIAHGNGIYLHNFSNGSFFDGSTNGVSASRLAYDPLSSLVYGLAGNQLYQINLAGGNVVNSFPIPGGTQEVCLLFNK